MAEEQNDRMKLLRTGLPPKLQKRIRDRFTSHLDETSKVSIEGRAAKTFVKIERADGIGKKE